MLALTCCEKGAIWRAGHAHAIQAALVLVRLQAALCAQVPHIHCKARGGGGRSKDCKVSNHQHSGRDALGCLHERGTGTSASKQDKTRGCLRCPTCAVAAAGEELGAVCCECTSAGSAIHLQRANHLQAQNGGGVAQSQSPESACAE